MVWYFIGVYIINRILHGCLEIRNFSSRVEKNISLACCPHLRNIFPHRKRNFVSSRGHVISSISSGWRNGFPNTFMLDIVINLVDGACPRLAQRLTELLFLGSLNRYRCYSQSSQKIRSWPA